MAVLSLILYYSFPGLPFHTPIAAVLSKLYSNSALAIFNSRIHILGGRDTTNGSGHTHISLNPTVAGVGSLANKIDSCIPTGQVHVHEEVYVHAEGGLPLEDLKVFLLGCSDYCAMTHTHTGHIPGSKASGACCV